MSAALTPATRLVVLLVIIMIKEVIMIQKDVSVAEAKKHFSELLGRVAYAGERIVISKRGRPMAILVPPVQAKAERSLSGIEGWLEEGDPFFEIMDQIVRRRAKHLPRVPRTPRR
jgi:prevent-host-death family protein